MALTILCAALTLLATQPGILVTGRLLHYSILQQAYSRTLLQATVPANVSEALDIFNQAGTLKNLTDATILAPTVQAWLQAANVTKVSDLFNNATLAKEVTLTTQKLIIPGVLVNTSSFTSTSYTDYTTQAGTDVSFNVDPGENSTVNVPTSDAFANILLANIPYQGNLVHLIDSLLIGTTSGGDGTDGDYGALLG